MPVFDPDELSAICRASLRDSPEQTVEAVVAALNARYGDVIDTDMEWFFSNAGGIMGTVTLLYSSLSEYLLIYATPIGSEGHSGRHRAHLWDYVLSGELWTYQEHELTARHFVPGDVAPLPKGESNGSRIADGTVLLEYARGAIPTLLPFGLMDAFTSTLDFKGIRQTFRIYGKQTVRALLRRR